MCMRRGQSDSLHEIIRNTAIDVLGITDEVAANFAQIAVANVTGFFLRFDNIPSHLMLRDVKRDGNRFIVEWESASTHADCPMCGKTSKRAHSMYLYSEMVQDVGVYGLSLWHKIYRKKLTHSVLVAEGKTNASCIAFEGY